MLLKSLDAVRGYHVLKIIYKSDWPKCSKCNQAITTDADFAYSLFCDADLWWDGGAVAHNKLRQILLGKDDDTERQSNHNFRDPQNYNLIPFREWARRELGRTGLVLADIDTGVRRFGPRFSLGPDGDAMLIETKERWPSG